LGGDTIIGRDCIIGGNVWLTTSVPDGTKVYHTAENKLVKKLNKVSHGSSH
jgi:serine O-acetyltransferase